MTTTEKPSTVCCIINWIFERRSMELNSCWFWLWMASSTRVRTISEARSTRLERSSRRSFTDSQVSTAGVSRRVMNSVMVRCPDSSSSRNSSSRVNTSWW